MQCRYYEHKPRKGKFQYRKRYGLHAIAGKRQPCGRRLVSIPQAVWIACNMFVNCCVRAQLLFQYRKRYGLHAMPTKTDLWRWRGTFQYRKRYGLHAIGRTITRYRFLWGFNTASGMDCMQYFETARAVLASEFQYRKRYGLHAIRALLMVRFSPQRFQYRKRYGLHAMTMRTSSRILRSYSFNTASGMDCMQFVYINLTPHDLAIVFQYRKRYGLHAISSVLEATILMQRFNTASGMDCMQFWRYGSVRSVQRFQYRKRYGLHAILSPRTLENSEPKRWFSSTPSLLHFSPNLREFFCRKKWLKMGAKPAISRKLLSTKKI